MKKFLSIVLTMAVMASMAVSASAMDTTSPSSAHTHSNGIESRYIPCPNPDGHNWVLSDITGCTMYICTYCGLESYIPY
ncbi:MAG: hypothetical protein RSB38_08605 [Oscillospiraceae bacterium]